MNDIGRENRGFVEAGCFQCNFNTAFSGFGTYVKVFYTGSGA